jgi:uncharacterized integral membrane protein
VSPAFAVKLVVIFIAALLVGLLALAIVEAVSIVAARKRRDRERDERSPFWRKKNSAP